MTAYDNALAHLIKPGQWYVGPDGQPRKKPGA